MPVRKASESRGRFNAVPRPTETAKASTDMLTDRKNTVMGDIMSAQTEDWPGNKGHPSVGGWLIPRSCRAVERLITPRFSAIVLT
jgi:hypothetical protein